MKYHPGEYSHYDAIGLAELIRSGEASPQELLTEAKRRLSTVNPSLNAVICNMDSYAEILLKHVPDRSIFGGVPFLVKDLLLPMKGAPMSNGSNAMKNHISAQDCGLAKKFQQAGLITFGKTNTSELGTASLTNPVAFGATLNPWNTEFNSGGSSGGSSAAVAARVVPMAYSSDGGSIRFPASYCGIFGFKPSSNINKYEDMSRAWGGAVVSHVSTISVRDSAAYLDLVADNKIGISNNSLTADNSTYLHCANTAPDKTLRIALITTAPTSTPVYQECIDAATSAAKLCESLGHQVEETSWGFNGRELMHAFLIIVFRYTNYDVANMARSLGVTVKQMDIELANKFMAALGAGVSPQAVSSALIKWEKAAITMRDLHKKYHVVLTPTVATSPLKSNALEPNAIEKLMMRFMLSTGLGKYLLNEKLLDTIINTSLYQTPFTPIANITGQPAMSVPLHWGQDGLPYGVHFMAAQGNDRLLFSLARQLEQAMPWKDRLPGLARN